MNAETLNPKSAAPSTPAAAPAGSPPAPDLSGADAEFDITAADVAAALGQLSEDPQAGTAGAEATPAGDSTVDLDENPAEGDPAAPEGIAAETPAESEEEAAVSGDPAAGASGDVDPTPPAEGTPEKNVGFQKRIDELTAARRTAEEEAAHLREQVAAFRQQSAPESAQLQHVDTPQELQQEQRRIAQLHEWAMRHETTGGKLPDGKGGEREFSPEDVLDLKANTFRMLQVDLPQRQGYLLQKQRIEAQATQAWPWLANTREGDGATVQRVIETLPGLRAMTPGYRVVVADAITGEKFRSAGIVVDAKLIDRLKAEQVRAKPSGSRPAGAAQAAPSALPRRLPPQSPARPGVLPSRVQPRLAQASAAAKRLSKGDGNVNDLTASIASKF